MPPRRGKGPEHARACCRAHEASDRGLVAGAVAEAHAAHAAVLQDPAGSAGTFLGEAALLAVRALNGAGAATLLPAIQQVVNAVRAGLDAVAHGQPVGPAAIHGARPAATSLQSSTLALLHALRLRHSMEEFPSWLRRSTS